MHTIELTREELLALRAWLAVLGFQGTAKELEKPLALHAGIMGKVEAALNQAEAPGAPVESGGGSAAAESAQQLTKSDNRLPESRST